MRSKENYLNRWVYLVVGVFAMLFAGVLYAWSILKVPFQENFGWSASTLAFNFTLTMCTFCIGAFVGSKLYKRIGLRLTVILAGVLVGGGFVLTGCLQQMQTGLLYVCYGILAGFGIGIAYNVVISSVSAWFPDKKGLCSGALMMGFGASTLLLGNVIDALFRMEQVGWQKAYFILGIVLAAVLIVAALILKLPGADVTLPKPKAGRAASRENFEVRDYTTLEMVKRFTFWRAFICLVCLTAVGNCVISFARDMVLSVGAGAGLATTMVGVLAVCNGLGRILTGALFDAAGRRTTMLAANAVTILAAGIALLAVMLQSLPLCIVGLCMTGLSYGSCPTVCSAFVSAFYGTKHFATNFSVINFNLIAASFIATASSSLLASTGSYVAPFVLLLVLSLAALVLNFSIRKP